MRVAITILVIISVLASVGLGVKWISDFNDYKDQIEEASSTADDLGIDIKDELSQVEKLKTAAYALIAVGILSLIAVIFIGKLKKISAIIFLLSAIVPAIFSPVTLIATFLFVISAILAFIYKPKVQTQQTTAA